MNRNEFFKKLGLGVGAGVVASVSKAAVNFENDSLLNEEQKEFLNEYKLWLSDFDEFLNDKNKAHNELAYNTRLMELSAQAEKRKPRLEFFMKDSVFANYFNGITAEITGKIA